MDVKWVAMENATRSALTNASEQVVHALNNTATQFKQIHQLLRHQDYQ